MSFCHVVDDVGEIGFGIEAVELGGFEHGVDDGGALTAGFGAEEQIVFTGDGDAAQGAFGGVVVDADAAVGGVKGQIFPAAERIVDGLGEIGLGGEAPALFLKIALELGQQRAGLFLAGRGAAFGVLAIDVGLDGVEFADPAQRLLSDR